MVALVVKTLCGNLLQHSPLEPFTTPKHNYYEALENIVDAIHHYFESEAAKSCTNITKSDVPDVTVVNGGFIIPSL